MKNKDENIRIAGKLTIGEWKISKEGLDPNNDTNWADAYNFFEERITTRYLNPISKISNMSSYSGEGFAVVNLQCSLIETIESFYNGWIYDYPDYKKNEKTVKCPWDESISLKNKHIFISFFEYRESFIELKIDGEDFFYNVRCGLLHETQTKNGWKIKANHPNIETFYEKNENDKILYRNNLQSAIEVVIYKYKRSIVFDEPFGVIPVRELRENFIAKIEHICKISKPKSWEQQ